MLKTKQIWEIDRFKREDDIFFFARKCKNIFTTYLSEYSCETKGCLLSPTSCFSAVSGQGQGTAQTSAVAGEISRDEKKKKIRETARGVGRRKFNPETQNFIWKKSLIPPWSRCGESKLLVGPWMIHCGLFFSPGPSTSSIFSFPLRKFEPANKRAPPLRPSFSRISH